MDGGLGLTNAVQSFQRGKEWRTQQDAAAKAEADKAKQQEISDGAKQVFQKSMTAPMIEVDAGNDGEGNPMPKAYAPDPKWDKKKARVNALTSVADYYAEKGDFKTYLATEAMAAPMRAEYRKSAIDTAMAQVQGDGDYIKFAQTIYPEIYDGKKIAHARPNSKTGKITFNFDDKSTQEISPEDLMTFAQKMRDPVAAAEYEAKERWETKQAKIKADAEERVAKTKSDLNISEENAKQNNRLGLASTENDFTLGQIGARTAGELAVVGARGKEDRKTAVERPDAAGKSLTAVQRSDMVIKAFGEPVNGFAGGNRIGNARTAAITEGMEAYLKQNPGASESEAMNAAAKLVPEPKR
jgi:hypothetical protein